MNTLSPKHTFWHDLYALFLGGSLIVLALVMLKSAGVFTSGLSGWAFLLSAVTPYAFGEILFVISVPFYIFAYGLLGFWFTLRTVVLITLISVSVATYMRTMTGLGLDYMVVTDGKWGAYMGCQQDIYFVLSMLYRWQVL